VGIVTKERHKGFTVRSFSAAEIQQMYEVREMLQRRLPAKRIAPADPSNGAEVDRLFAAAGAIIHLGAVGAVDGFERIPESCIVGAKNISERHSAMASRESSSRARSIVICFYPMSQVVDAEALPRPDLPCRAGRLRRN
jgi:hypothetical protein